MYVTHSTHPRQILKFQQPPSATTPEDLVKSEILKSFQEVPYIGPAKALQLYNSGARSAVDLRGQKFLDMLSPIQSSSVRYHEHLRVEVSNEDAESVRDFLHRYLGPRQFDVTLVGAYRRNSGGSCIDVILAHPSNVCVPKPADPAPHLVSGPVKTKVGRKEVAFRGAYTSKAARGASLLLKNVIPVLGDRGLVATTISESTSSWVGVVRVPERRAGGSEDPNFFIIDTRTFSGAFRKLNITLVPPKTSTAAILYLTGDEAFVSHLKTRAQRMGMLLNEFGLWKWESSPANEATLNSLGAVEDRGWWTLVKTETERDIFMGLGMEYVKPERRNWAALDHSFKHQRR